MEELRSTDVLDRKIREDSAKKAADIVARAEENARKILDEVNDRVQRAEAEVNDASKKRLEVLENNLNASLPLEKQRYLVSFINDSIVEAIENYFENLDSSKKEQLIEKLAVKAKSVTGDAKVNALVCGKMTKAEAEKILKKVFDSKCNGVEENAKANVSNPKDYGVILWTEDKKITCRLTIEEITNEILGQNREQLALSLFGGRLPE